MKTESIRTAFQDLVGDLNIEVMPNEDISKLIPSNLYLNTGSKPTIVDWDKIESMKKINAGNDWENIEELLKRKGGYVYSEYVFLLQFESYPFIKVKSESFFKNSDTIVGTFAWDNCMLFSTENNYIVEFLKVNGENFCYVNR